jgi:hypothetical protein
MSANSTDWRGDPSWTSCPEVHAATRNDPATPARISRRRAHQLRATQEHAEASEGNSPALLMVLQWFGF